MGARAMIDCICCGRCGKWATATGGGICEACVIRESHDAERDQLRAELAAAKELAEANWTECERLRDSMWEYRSDNARLRAAMNRAYEGAARQLAEPRNHDNDQYALTDIATTCELALAATPAQSLAAHDAALLREVAKRFAYRRNDGDWTIHPDSLTDEADRIAKEAANA